ncbi:MAG: hypothetical protein U0166_19245 [Acidobacteriota bacterium]
MSVEPLSDGERRSLLGWIRDLFAGPLLGGNGVPRAEIGSRSTEDLLPELADWAPLLAAAGSTELALSQAERAIVLLRQRPVLRGLKTRFTLGRLATLLRALGASHLQDYAEILLGFVQLHEVTRDPLPLAWARELAALLDRLFGTRHGLASLRLAVKLPAYEPLSGILVEALFDLARLSGDGATQALARRTLDPFLDNPTFLSTGLWPAFVAPSPRARPLPLPAARRIDLAKANTAMGSALLAAYVATGEARYREALTRLLTVGLAHLDAGGALHNLAFVTGGGRRVVEQAIVSSSNHAVAELLLDAHAAIADPALLQRAIAISRFWRDRIHGVTGLMPDVVGRPDSFVDGNTDFAVIFWRLGRITGDASWRAASEGLVQAVARWHRADLGLVRRTDAATGAVLDPVIETRYTSLFLKPLLCLGPDPVPATLLRDR